VTALRDTVNPNLPHVVRARGGHSTRDAALHIVAAAAWDGALGDPNDLTLAAALDVARRNRVERQLVEAFPARLSDPATRLDGQRAAFRRALAESGRVLDAAGVPACLIKVDPAEDLAYENFDVVVPREWWPAALAALAVWATGTSHHRLERDKRFLHNPDGPDLHLHSRVSWYEVPVVDAEPLLARTEEAVVGFRRPAAPDRLRILLAHAAFQTMCLDLRDLLELRALGDAATGDARELARAEGWSGLFEHAHGVGTEAIAALDRGRTPRLPAPLSGRVALARGAEHVRRLARRERAGALREAALRPALVAAKLRRGDARW
jgi:hypothetical protein